MSLKFLYSSEKTNSFRPTPWHFSQEPFPAFRGAGARYSAFQAVEGKFVPNFSGPEPIKDGSSCPREAFDPRPSKIIETTQKKTRLLVSCPVEEDEKILLLTLRGGFRGYYSRIEPVDTEILSKQGCNVHCCPTEHIVARIKSETGFIFTETGRRSGSGLIEIFSWKDGYKSIPTEEFNAWRDTI